MSITLHELQRRLKGFDVRAVVVETITETAPDIIKLNQGQLFIGRRADGHQIEPEYADITVRLKKLKGQPYDRVTLRDTGAFWDEIIVRNITANSYTVDDTNEKSDRLIKKYGGQILGLSKASKSEEYIPNYFFPLLKAKIFERTGLVLGQ